MWRVLHVGTLLRIVSQALSARYSADELRGLVRHVENGGDLKIDVRVT